MSIIDHYDTCCHPKCDNAISDKIESPLCDRHSQRVYLAVKELVATATPEQIVASQGYRGSNHVTNTSRVHGVVYFILRDGLIKIGFTANLAERLRQLNATQRDLLATMPGTQADERALHTRFRDLRERGEWFRIGPDLVMFIGALWTEAA